MRLGSEMSDQTILIELDALLDTRLGALSRLGIEWPARLMADTPYWERETDDFGEQLGGAISTQAYQEVYNARGKDLEVLKASGLTMMPQLLGPMSRTLQARKIKGLDVVGRIRFLLNVYPYPLEAEECEAFCEALRPYIALSAEIETVSLPLKDITPEYLASHCDLFILYHFDEWDKLQRENLMRTPIPEVTLMVPQLYPRKPTEQDITSETGHRYDPFKLICLVYLEHLALEVQPVFLYSLIRPD